MEKKTVDFKMIRDIVTDVVAPLTTATFVTVAGSCLIPNGAGKIAKVICGIGLCLTANAVSDIASEHAGNMVDDIEKNYLLYQLFNEKKQLEKK